MNTTIAQELQAPRVTPAAIEANIASEHYMVPYDEFENRYAHPERPPEALKLLTLCILVLKNGFTVVGKSACASPEIFDATLGREYARKDAVQQCWPLMGYELKTALYLAEHNAPSTEPDPNAAPLPTEPYPATQTR